MTDKYQNKYRIPSARAAWWDYSNAGLYFVTICTQGMLHYFGQVENGIMQLSEIGKIVETEWLKTIELRPDMNLRLDQYVIMPNHFHAIIMIGFNSYNSKCIRDTMRGVSNTFGPQSKNLASIIRGFKSGVTVNARKIHADFAWQARYHDHIIRNSQEYDRIANYIMNNPVKWQIDKFYAQ